jgi:hypothetical protein
MGTPPAPPAHQPRAGLAVGLTVVVGAACSAPGPMTSSAPSAPSLAAPRVAGPARPAPVVVPIAPGPCPLVIDEVLAPARIPLRAAPVAAPDDDCPGGFDPAAALVAGCGDDDDDCQAGPVGAGGRAHATLDGPGGSGRFWAIGLAVDAGAGAAPRWACVTGSTVGWRLLVAEAVALAPLPWLRDLDGDGAVEFITWGRLPFGPSGSEVANALLPVAYQITASELVRRDDLARAVAAPVADAYRRLHADDGLFPPTCRAAVIDALTR